jgi:Tumour suppressing sub-chromosomal transferable candidate 4
LQEEEDEYDRVAFGQDKATDRVYMNQVMDHGPDISIYSVVPEVYDNYVDNFQRDPRANRSVACKRIKEDDIDIPRRPCNSPKISALDPNLKPILKRRDSEDDPKPKKRVRFDPEFKEENKSISQTAPQPTEEDDKVTGVPDYMRNPSKYTKYTFSSTNDNDEEMNMRAFQEFQSLINQSNRTRTESDPSFELPASVLFTPRKKLPEDAMSIDVSPAVTNEVAAASSSCLVGVAAGVGNETCEMEEDFVEENPTITTKLARRYRLKVANEE